MAHLFISHSTRDGATQAFALAQALEALGHRCWIAPRDVRPAVPYPGQIVAAIEQGAGLVLLVTPGANESPDVLQEVQLASSARKPIAPVIVSATAPSNDLRYYIGVRHQIAWAEASATAHALTATFVPGAKNPARSKDPHPDRSLWRGVWYLTHPGALGATSNRLPDQVGPDQAKRPLSRAQPEDARCMDIRYLRRVALRGWPVEA